MNELLAHQSDASWEHIAPHLDAALGELGEPDRDALLLRYFERKTAREMALSLGVSEEAAQKRVSRAVERLREFFAKRGVTIGAGGLVVLVTANAVQAAPLGLAVAISTAAMLSVPLATATIATHTTLNWINAKVITAVLASAVVAGTTAHFVHQNETDGLRRENQDLAAQRDNLTKERDAAVVAAAARSRETARLQPDQSELLRLRGEVSVLRDQQTEVARLRQENQNLRTEAAAQARAAAAAAAVQPRVGMSAAELRNACINNLRQIDGAMQQCALELKLSVTNIVTEEQILPYLGNQGLMPVCPAGGTYTFGSLTNAPTCSIQGHALQ